MAKTNNTPELSAEELAVQEAKIQDLARIAESQAEKDKADILAIEKADAEVAEHLAQKVEPPTVAQYFESNAKCVQLYFAADGIAFYTQDAAQDYANSNLSEENREVKTVTNPNL